MSRAEVLAPAPLAREPGPGRGGARRWAARRWAARRRAAWRWAARRGAARHAPARSAPDTSRRMISGASLVLGGTMVGQASNFVFNAAGAHALGPSRYGVLAASVALLSFATPLLAALQSVASREATSLMARRQQQRMAPMLRHYGLRVAAGSLLLGGAVAAASGWLSGLFRLGSPWPVVLVGSIVPCYMVGHLLGGLLQGAERFGRFAAESVIEGLTKAVAGVLAMGLLWRSALSGMTAVALSGAAGLITYLVLTVPLLRRYPHPPHPAWGHAAPAAPGRRMDRRERARRAPGVVGYSMTALVTYGLLAVMLSADTLIAKHYLSSEQAGLYAGVSLTGKIAFFAASSLFVIAFPVFSRHHDQGVSSGKWILIAGGVVCATGGLIAALFAAEPSWVVIPLLGARYRAAEHYVPWMAAVFALYALGYLMSIYLLARKCRGVIPVLGAAMAVQLAGFFAFHSTLTRMMGVLAAAFAVMVIGELPLVVLGGGPAARTGGRRQARSRHQRAGSGRPTAMGRAVPGVPPLVPRPRGPWHEQIVAEVTRHVGRVPVLLAGSRALGTAHAASDYDVSVVLPLLRIPRAAPRLARASGNLSTQLGVPVTVNAVPEFRMRRPGGSLFVGKLRAEGVVLAAPRGWSLSRQPLTGVTAFAACSMLLSAVRSLLEAFDPGTMTGPQRRSGGRSGGALRKAALLVAQVRLLRSGCYASDLAGALALLRGLPPTDDGIPGPELATALTASLTAPTEVEGFMCLRRCILQQLAPVGDRPFHVPAAKSLVRNAQYAALARLRGRKRWRVALRRELVESALARTQLALLCALDPGAAGGVDVYQLGQAERACPLPPRPAERRSWEDLRALVLAEWLDAHPLVGLLA
jgi:O-antigen/teichoic acid export membrane protein